MIDKINLLKDYFIYILTFNPDNYIFMLFLIAITVMIILIITKFLWSDETC